METVKIPTSHQKGKIFAIDGIEPRIMRTGEIFDIDGWMDAERYSNGQVFTSVDGTWRMVDPRTVDFCCKILLNSNRACSQEQALNT